MGKSPYRFANIGGEPSLKHLNFKKFTRLAPILNMQDFTTVCVIRHPLSRLDSWFRYRSRPKLKGKPKYSGDMTLSEFAQTINPNEIDDRMFIYGRSADRCVDLVFRYEALGDFEAWLQSIYGPEFALGQHNVSPKRNDSEVDDLASYRARFSDIIDWYESLEVDPATGAVKHTTAQK